MKLERILCAAIVFAIANASASFSQNACQRLKGVGNSQLDYKDRGNRCEGLYEQHIGAQAIAIVSFSTGPIQYLLQPHQKLTVRVQGATSAVNVRAIPTFASLGYEMDATINAGQSLTWPIDDVLLPEHLVASQLGVYAWKLEGDQQIFLPVRVTTDDSNESKSPDILLTLRPSMDVQVFKWRWSGTENGVCATPGTWQDASGSTDAGQTITIKLPQFQGRHCVDIAARGSTNDWTTTKFQVEDP